MGRHQVGQKRFENKYGISARDRSAQRRAARDADASLLPVRREEPKARLYRPRPTATRMTDRQESPTRRMPFGVCSGCREEGPLPPFGDGMCFLCATDGPPGEHTQKGGALDEDADARSVSGWENADDEELHRDVEEIFRDANRPSRWINLSSEIAEEFESLTCTEGDLARAAIHQAQPDQKLFRFFRATGLGRRSVTEWLIGERFGRLKVLRRTTEMHKGSDLFECECSCGSQRRVLCTSVQLRWGNKRSCGCLNSKEEHSKRLKQVARRRAIKVEYHGATVVARDLAEQRGVDGKLLVYRLRRGFTIDVALEERWVHRCSLCLRPGHNKRRCPTLGERPSVMRSVERTATVHRPRKPPPPSAKQKAAAAACRRRLTDGMIGQRFGKLLVMRRTENRRGAHDLFECLCSCGNSRHVLATSCDLKRGRVKSCGCLLSVDARRERSKAIAERRVVRVQFRGRTVSLDELAALTGTNKGTIRKRMAQGLDAETAATMKPERVRKPRMAA